MKAFSSKKNYFKFPHCLHFSLYKNYLTFIFLHNHKPSLSSSEKRRELPTPGFKPPTLPSDFQFPVSIHIASPTCNTTINSSQYIGKANAAFWWMLRKEQK